MKILITGGCGFLGSNLAARSLVLGNELVVFDNLSRVGSRKNLQWLQDQGVFRFVEGDIACSDSIESCVKEFLPDCIFHLAGQVAMTTSIEHPRRDFYTNTVGTFNLLEAVRQHSLPTKIIYSSTNKVYGDFTQVEFVEDATRYRAKNHPNGFDEKMPLAFHSPYGCSKGAADQYILDYARIFHVRGCVFRHSSIYGARQYSTFDQGWIGWFVAKALEIQKKMSKSVEISGTGKQVRDVLFIEDIIDCYFAAIESFDEVEGEAFNIGGGMNNSLSLIELFQILEQELKIHIPITTKPWRVSDQKVFVADITKIANAIDWSPKWDKFEGISKMIDWIKSYA